MQTCCSEKSEKPLIKEVEIPLGCGHRNEEGIGFRITGDKDNEAQYGLYGKNFIFEFV